ncbi:alpha/beta hydrolase [Oleisolibacter albus]|uniref:alpha/beta hydrolase n=1 Tax=Oleisolibacter albus TaxID=2171757 RepID=UPI000DF49B58|nr:alpha/beta fold hydrolase [Oleisolibacter albus]
MLRRPLVLLLLLVGCLFHPVQAAEVQLSTPTGALFGTLLTTPGDGPMDVVILHAGSGPTDRDGNNPKMRNDSLKLLAEGLAQAGWGSLRMDKRAIAASAAAGAVEQDLRFDTYVDDLVAWTGWLRQQPRVRRIVLLGHSEGALIATAAAGRVPLAGLVLLNGAGHKAGDVIRAQLAAAPMPPDLRAQADSILTSLEQGKTVAEVPPPLAMLYRPSVQPYMISWLRHDPAALLADLRLPVLIVGGSTDLLVGAADFRALAAARPDATAVMLDGMNHVLKTAPADRAANIAAYGDPSRPLHPGLMPVLTGFLEKLPPV